MEEAEGERPDFIEEMARQFEALPAGDDSVMSRIEETLLGRMKPGASFSELVIEVFEGYEVHGGHPEGGLLSGPLRRAFQELQADCRRPPLWLAVRHGVPKRM